MKRLKKKNFEQTPELDMGEKAPENKKPVANQSLPKKESKKKK